LNDFLIAFRDALGTAVVFGLTYFVLRLARPDVINHRPRTLVVVFSMLILASTAYNLARQGL
jgi:hypothetical protein